jgi:hypothetical protein
MKTTTSVFALFFLGAVAFAARPASATLVGLWEFDDASDLTKATIGADLELTDIIGGVSGGSASHSAVAGTGGTDGASRVPVGSSYKVTHGIAPNGGGAYVNEYTLLMDIQYETLGQWISLYQTNTGNVNDGELFVNNANQGIGLAGLGGYSYDQDNSRATTNDTWYRVVLSVDNGTKRNIYVDGNLWLDGNAGGIDDRHSLDPFFYLFADESGEEDHVHVTNAALWDTALDASTVADLGGASAPIPEPSTAALAIFALASLVAGTRRRGSH